MHSMHAEHTLPKHTYLRQYLIHQVGLNLLTVVLLHSGQVALQARVDFMQEPVLRSLCALALEDIFC